MQVHLPFTIITTSTSTATKTTTSTVHKAAYFVGNVFKCGTFSPMKALWLMTGAIYQLDKHTYE